MHSREPMGLWFWIGLTYMAGSIGAVLLMLKKGGLL